MAVLIGRPCVCAQVGSEFLRLARRPAGRGLSSRSHAAHRTATHHTPHNTHRHTHCIMATRTHSHSAAAVDDKAAQAQPAAQSAAVDEDDDGQPAHNHSVASACATPMDPFTHVYNAFSASDELTRTRWMAHVDRCGLAALRCAALASAFTFASRGCADDVCLSEDLLSMLSPEARAALDSHRAAQREAAAALAAAKADGSTEIGEDFGMSQVSQPVSGDDRSPAQITIRAPSQRCHSHHCD